MDDTRARRPGLGPLVLLALLLAAATTALLLLATGATPAGLAEPDPTVVDPHVAANDAPPSDQGFALWSTDHRGGPLRWDACAPVRFVLSTVDAPVDAQEDLERALTMLAEASGLELVLEATTEERPDARRPLVERDGDGWRWRPVLVAWATPEGTDLPLGPADRGLAVPVAVRDGAREAFVTGQVVINAARSDLVAGFGDRTDAVGATLVHEIAHVLGLDHVEDPDQLMSADPGRGPVVLGEGDRAGLRAVGADAGCNPAPSASAGRGLTASR